MLRDRTLFVFILAFAGMVAFANFRPSSPDPADDVRTQETEFYINKAHPRERFDGVIIGDSRALRGLSPAAMTDSLPGLSLLNFAFNACGMSDDIYAAAESVLARDSSRRFIVLAPTALAFQPWKRANTMYWEYKRKARDLVWVYQSAPELAHATQPVSPSLAPRRLLGITPAKLLVQNFHDDGWIETHQTPIDDLSDLEPHRQRLVGNSVDSTMIAGLMRQTRAWTTRGVRVFAFYPPALPARTAMEDSMLGFDRGAFAAEFTAAGGTWLEVESAGLTTYDGSHLDGESAKQLSARLAGAMRRSW